MSLSNPLKHTLAAARTNLIHEFTAAGIEPAAVNADWLLEHVTGLSGIDFALANTRELTPAEQTTLTQLAQRRMAGEPVQYIVGSTEFYGRQFAVEPGVLIPRPETERFVELILQVGGKRETMLDVGTGSGVIAITAALERPQWRVWGSDINPAAVALASRNALLLGASVSWFLSDLLAAIPAADKTTIIAANLPYLPETDQATVAPELAYEPADALYSGPDGINHAVALLDAVAELPGERVTLLELDPRNVGFMADLARRTGFPSVEVAADLTGRNRYLIFA